MTFLLWLMLITPLSVFAQTDTASVPVTYSKIFYTIGYEFAFNWDHAVDPCRASMGGAYVPQRWGGYLKGGFGAYTGQPHVEAGAIYRISSGKSRLDWQAYGDVAYGPRLGVEAGVRLAAPAPTGIWGISVLHVSTGILYNGDVVYGTVYVGILVGSAIAIAIMIPILASFDRNAVEM